MSRQGARGSPGEEEEIMALASWSTDWWEALLGGGDQLAAAIIPSGEGSRT